MGGGGRCGTSIPRAGRGLHLADDAAPLQAAAGDAAGGGGAHRGGRVMPTALPRLCLGSASAWRRRARVAPSLESRQMINVRAIVCCLREGPSDVVWGAGGGDGRIGAAGPTVAGESEIAGQMGRGGARRGGARQHASGEELEPEIAHCGHILQCYFQFHKYFCVGRVSLGRWVRTSEVGDPPL